MKNLIASILLLSSLSLFGAGEPVERNQASTNKQNALPYTWNEIMLRNTSGTNTLTDASVGLEGLRTFYDSLNANTGSIRLLIIGDSLANQFPDSCGVSYGVVQHLIDQYGIGGTAPRTGRYVYNKQNNASRFYNISFKNGSGSPNTDGWGENSGDPISTEYFGHRYYTTNSVYYDWYNYSDNEDPRGDNIGFAWVARPDGTNFWVLASANGGSTYTPIALCDGQSATVGFRYTNISVAMGNYRVRATNSLMSAKTNLWVGPSVIDSTKKGVVPYVLAKGGAGLTYVTNAMATMHGVLTNWNPDLIILNIVDFGEATPHIFESQLTNAMKQWFGLRTNTPVLVIGSQLNLNGETFAYGDNAIMRKTSLINRWTFFDPSFYCNNLTRARGEGYYADAVHLLQKGAKYLAQPLMSEADLMFPPRMLETMTNVATAVATGTSVRPTNYFYFSVTDVDVLIGGSSAYDQVDEVRYNGPNGAGPTTVGGAWYFSPRNTIGMYTLLSSYKLWAHVSPWDTKGKTNLVVWQKYWCTNTAYFGASCNVDFVSDAGDIRQQAGAGANMVNNPLGGSRIVAVTNTFTFSSDCTNGLWSLWLGRANSSDPGAPSNTTNTQYWIGAQGYFY